jgi:hypothetical protein
LLGAGAYKISGGANGGGVFGEILGRIIFQVILVVPAIGFLFAILGPLLAAAILIFVSWSAVLIEAQELPSGSALRGILANMAYGAFGLAIGALTGSLIIALLWWVVSSIANYYISYNYNGNRRCYCA